MWQDIKIFIKKYYKDVLLVLLAALSIILLLSTTCTHQKNSALQQNITALTDTISTYKLKNGEILSTKHSLIIEKKELEKYLEVSKAEVKDLEKKLDGKISYITRIEGQIKVDTLVMHDSIYIKDSITYIQFDYEDQWLKTDGTVVFLDTLKTTLNNIEMRVPLKTGYTSNNQFYATTSNPYVIFDEIESAAISNTKQNKKYNWNIGLQTGIGIQYGIIGHDLDVGPYIGIGVSFGWCF